MQTVTLSEFCRIVKKVSEKSYDYLCVYTIYHTEKMGQKRSYSSAEDRRRVSW